MIVHAPPSTPTALSALAAGGLLALLWGCSADEGVPLTADRPLHLEEHLEAATVDEAASPSDLPSAVEWLFDEPQPEWRPIAAPNRSVVRVQTTRVDDALRIHLDEENRITGPGGSRLEGGVYLDLPDWRREDWAQVLVRARTEDRIGSVQVTFNLRAPGDVTPPNAVLEGVFTNTGEYADLFPDSTAHTYALQADWSYEIWQRPWRQLGLVFTAQEPGSIDILSVTVVPKDARFAASSSGVGTLAPGGNHRRVLYTHTPSRISYRIDVPEGGRLDTDLGVIRRDSPVTFRVAVEAGDGQRSQTVLQTEHSDEAAWSQQAVDLSEWGGRAITLSLEAEAEREGTVALWASPTVSGTRATDLPNVILYVIDGGGADYMSVYGYNRSTTPHLERLAADGAVFEHAFSNSTWSKTSTPSFMTGLQHSVLGGYVNDSDRLPDGVVTLPEHLHAAGYQTAVITSNPYAGTMSGLERGVDFLRERGVEPNSISSEELHEDFWRWREAFPGEPYFVHFQTTDVHWPWRPAPPFAGSFISVQDSERYREWERRLAEAAGMSAPRWLSARLYPDAAFEETGIDRQMFFALASALYDETMAHNDRQIGRLVARLKAAGEWEHTLLIVGADHGNDHAFGSFEPQPSAHPMLRSYVTRVPLIVVWPGRIQGGLRFAEPVSMIDVLPTVLALAGLPDPEVTQGANLAPLLQGQPDVEVQPVILEEAYFAPHTRALSWAGIEIIDGRWGASLSIEPSGDGESGGAGEPGAAQDGLLLYDLWTDPFALRSLHAERPELAEHYRSLLLQRWEAHQELGQRFSPTAGATLTPEQLRTLRSLGYIR
jgi:arylsulfatase A-like enzyme